MLIFLADFSKYSFPGMYGFEKAMISDVIRINLDNKKYDVFVLI